MTTEGKDSATEECAFCEERAVRWVGDAHFHNETVQHYNSILAVLEALLDVPAEVVR